MQDSLGNSPLHIASWLTQNNVVKMLIERGANVNIQNKLLETPMQKAAEIGSVMIFELLLKSGADPEIRDKVKRTPFDWAKLQKHESIMELYKKWVDENKPESKETIADVPDIPLSLSNINDYVHSII